jgi:hypothetical protein
LTHVGHQLRAHGVITLDIELTFSSPTAYSVFQISPTIGDPPKGIGSLRYLFEEYVFDTELREMRRGSDLVFVTPQVFDLLDYLISNRERVVSKDDLINAVWKGRPMRLLRRV